MLMFSHGVSSGWLRRRRAAARSNSPALAGGDPGVGKEGYRGPGPAPPQRFSAWRAISYPAGRRGEVFNVCREIKRKFPLALDDALLDQEVVHRRFVARRQRRVSDPGPDRRVGGAANRLRSLAPNGITFPAPGWRFARRTFRR